MSKLPRALLDQDTLTNLRVGESAYTKPWAMWVDADMECWLHPNYSTHRDAGGTANMLVERRQDGYHVFPPRGETYQPSEAQGFMNHVDTPWIPVAQVHVSGTDTDRGRTPR